MERHIKINLKNSFRGYKFIFHRVLEPASKRTQQIRICLYDCLGGNEKGKASRPIVGFRRVPWHLVNLHEIGILSVFGYQSGADGGSDANGMFG